MQRKNYYGRYYKRYNSNSVFEDLADLIFTLYILYLGTQLFLDRANFWRWVMYGIAILVLGFVILLAITKFRKKSTREIYFPYRKYIKHQPTPEALKLGNLLKNMGWKVEFEKWDGYKHIDIAITEAKFNIEVEGSQHNLNPNQAFRDQMRDYYSEQKGFVTKRVPNSLLRDNVRAEETARLIDRQLRERILQLKK